MSSTRTNTFVKLRNQHVSFGGIFVISGAAMFILNVLTLVYSDERLNYKSGIWLGIFTALGGILAVIAARTDQKSCLYGALAMDILCACTCFLVLIFSILEIRDRSHILNFTKMYSYIMLFAVLIGSIMFIVHAGMCCFDTCSCCAVCCAACSCCCVPHQPPPPPPQSLQPGGVSAVSLPNQGQNVNFQYPNYPYSAVVSSHQHQVQYPGQPYPPPPPLMQPSYNPAYSSMPQPSAPMAPPPSAPGQFGDMAPPSYDEVIKLDAKS